MKNTLFIFFICLTLQSCFYMNGDDDFPETEFVGNYEPVIMTRTDFETSSNYVSTPQIIENSGKIYVKGNYIIVNEVNKGFHIINNSDPTNPNNVGFVKVLGSSDLSIKSEVFYANNATDLIAFRIDDSSDSINITKRVRDVFPQIWSPEGIDYYNLQEDEIIVDWILIE